MQPYCYFAQKNIYLFVRFIIRAENAIDKQKISLNVLTFFTLNYKLLTKQMRYICA